MTTGAPPPNFRFVSSKRIAPSWHVPTASYNAAGYIEHPLAFFGRVGGAHTEPVFPPDSAGHIASANPPNAGVTGLGIGGPAMNAGGGGHFFSINNRAPHRNYF